MALLERAVAEHLEEFYAFTGRIIPITQALLLLGLNKGKGLLLGIHASDLMKGMEELWGHSVATAVVAQVTARKKAVGEASDLFVIGLLHDVGKVLLYLEFPDKYRQALTLAHDRGS
jgi:HD-like signal output (HDOD) protein